jgi:long-subunit fatty acid transport protein
MMIRMPKILVPLLCSATLLLFAVETASAQSVEFSSSLNPVGSGARATGMGGAFIGVADDATAASWNPAGLIQLEKPEISMVYSAFSRDQAYDSLAQPGITGYASGGGLNYASVAYPFMLCSQGKEVCRNMVFSLNYQRLYEVNKKLDLPFKEENLPPGDYYNYYAKIRKTGNLYALSPAMAVQVLPSLSIGATLNFWKDYSGGTGGHYLP